jgi:hypothetical protein
MTLHARERINERPRSNMSVLRRRSSLRRLRPPDFSQTPGSTACTDVPFHEHAGTSRRSKTTRHAQRVSIRGASRCSPPPSVCASDAVVCVQRRTDTEGVTAPDVRGRQCRPVACAAVAAASARDARTLSWNLDASFTSPQRTPRMRESYGRRRSD